MSLFRQRNAEPSSLIPPRRGTRKGSVDVTSDSAMRHSAVWASIRLRADLVSLMPLDAFRKIPSMGVDVEVTKPKVLVTPSSHGEGQPMDITEWMYSTQSDLDRMGNAFGLVTETDALGLPAQIEPQSADKVTVIVKKGLISGYRIGRDEYKPAEVWHERQFTTSGVHVGMSPVSFAALAIGGALSAQQFAQDWFSSGAVPGAHLKNTSRTLDAGEAQATKRRFLETVGVGEPFVTGRDWEYNMLQATANESRFIEEMQFSISDLARFFGVPGDMIDAPAGGGSITYANVTQRNLQLLIMNLGPTINRRERALSRLLSNPRHVKLNTDAILRMDPQTRQEVFKTQIDSRTLAPSEARALDNRAPFTPEQIAEFSTLFPAKAAQPTPNGVPS